MGRTKLNQDQIENLSEDLSGLQLNDTSLESKISIEDSINDAVDVSLDQRITYEDSINDAVDASIIAKVNSIESAMANLSGGGGGGESDQLQSVLISQIFS